MEMIVRAYQFGKERHARSPKPRRASGHWFFTHPIAVARKVAAICPDPTAIAAALLHDVIEDTDATFEEVASVTSREAALLVTAVTHLRQLRSRVPAHVYEEAVPDPSAPRPPMVTSGGHHGNKESIDEVDPTQAETIRRMVVDTNKDLRVIVIKLCDRMHNMETLQWLKVDRRKFIANETLDIYAPIAHMLGMTKLRATLEDLAMREMYPDEYRDMAKMVAKKKGQRDRLIDEMCTSVKAILESKGLASQVTGRPKHFYSMWQKMKRQDLTFDQLYDALAIRVIVGTTEDCWQALGFIYSVYTPVPNRLHNYISHPKDNGYRSLHTTVLGPSGERVEIQIRTEEMHREAEEGVSAHWRYKYGGGQSAKTQAFESSVSSFRSLVDNLQHVDVTQIRTVIKDQAEQSSGGSIYPTTPKGKVIVLPVGSTPIDFAYHIHSDVGEHCAGARVDGRFVPISTPLLSGQAIEIITSPTAHPTHDWLETVKSNRAKVRISRWLKEKNYGENVKLGRAMIHQAARNASINLTPQELDEALDVLVKARHMHSIEVMYSEVGFGSRRASDLVERLKQHLRREKQKRKEPTSIQSSADPEEDIIIDGIDARMELRFARCCLPVQGEPIVAFNTRGRGMTIHRKGCPTVQRSRSSKDGSARIHSALWRSGIPSRVRQTLFVYAQDRTGILADVSHILRDESIFIAYANTVERDPRGKVIMRFDIAVEPGRNVDKAVKRIKSTHGITEVLHRQETDVQPYRHG